MCFFAPKIAAPPIPPPPPPIPEAPEMSARRARRPEGLLQAQQSAAAQGTGQLRIPLLPVNLPGS